MKRLWATPTKSFIHQYRNLRSDRGLSMLFNQLFYDQETQRCYNSGADGVEACMLSRRYDVNPCFLEHLMGYPPGWTAAV